MNRKIKIAISTALIALVMVCALPVANLMDIDMPEIFVPKAEAASFGYLTYTVSYGKVTITDCDYSAKGDIDIPAYLDGYPVKTIASKAFAHCDGITSLYIPETAITIGEDAFFGCVKLEKFIVNANNSNFSSDESGVLFNKNKTEILQYPLGKTETAYTVPYGVTSIGQAALYGCTNLTSITFPDSLKTINRYALQNCTALRNVVIGNGVTSIDDYAFSGCSRLNEITIPVSAQIYKSKTFDGCTNVEKVTLTKGIGYAYDYDDFSLEYTPWYFSRNNPNGIEVVIEDGVTGVGDGTFCRCYGLKSVTIGKDLRSIGEFAFGGCRSLTGFTVSSENPYYLNDSEGILFSKDKTVLVLYPEGKAETTYVIPNEVKSIGESAFSSCNGLTSITIPDSVTSIGSYAFEDCTGLTSITIPDNVTKIGKFAFSGCKGLTSVTIPDSVTELGRYAFRDCRGLTNVKIGNGIKHIEDYTFTRCTKLKSVTIGKNVTNISGYAFEGCTGLKEITMPVSAGSPDYDYAFEDCTNIEKVTLTKGTGVMQNYVNYSSPTLTVYTCTPWYASKENMKEIIIENGVTNIGDRAFCGCIGLKSITVPKSVKSIGEKAFEKCTSLTDIYYSGTEKEWKAISVAEGNDCLVNINVHYNSADSSNPDNPSVNPSATVVEYGDSVVLSVRTYTYGDYSGVVSIHIDASNSNFRIDVSDAGDAYILTPVSSGDTTFTISLTDENGTPLGEEQTLTLTAKAGFFQKIIGFFRKLFGLTKAINKEIKIVF